MRILGYVFLIICAGLSIQIVNAQEYKGTFFDNFKSLNSHRWYISNGWTNGDHQACEWRSDAISLVTNSLQMELSDNGGKLRKYGCAEMHTTDRLNYGFYEARIRTAAGPGLNTAFYTYVGPPTGGFKHNEIDFEFLGKDPNSVQVNYYTSADDKNAVMVPLGFDASKDFHDYAIEWTPKKIRWYADGKKIHETPDGATMPIYPGRLYLSLWSGTSVEDSWLGPFQYTAPVDAYVAWVAYSPEGEKCLFPQSITCK